MSKEVIILILAWVIVITMLMLFVPKNRFREAQVIFSAKQLITWLFGLTIVQYRLIEYPVRLFSYASKASFTFEYFVYPAICIIFNFLYPKKKNNIGQFMHYFYFCTALTIIEILLEKYTNVIKYIHWSWYLTWITLLITFFIVRKYYVWFFNLNPKNKRFDMEN